MMVITIVLIKHIITGTQGLIFVIDSSDQQRMDEARQELHRIINDREMKDSLLLVFANKQDIKDGQYLLRSIHTSYIHAALLLFYTAVSNHRELCANIKSLCLLSSFEPNTSNRGPPAQQAQGQALVRGTQLRYHRRGSARRSTMALYQRESPTGAGQEVGLLIG